MWTLLKLLVFRDLTRHRVRTVLTVAGVALGVSIYVAMRTANVEIIRSFEASASSVTGRAALQIIGGDDGFDETLIVPVRKTLGVLEATPVLEISAILLGRDDAVRESLLVLGVDVLDQGRFWAYSGHWERGKVEGVLAVDAITVSKAFARRHDLDIGDRMTLLVDIEPQAVVVRGVFDDTNGDESVHAHVDGLAVMDIASAQNTFNRLGRLDRMSVVIDPDAKTADIRQRLQAIMPDGIRVQASSDRVTQVERLTRAFRVNLTVLSSVALMVGLFLVYNTVTFSVIQRRRDIGILRSLGMRRRQVMGIFVAEALCLGVMGGVLGTVLGLLMAKSALYTVSATVSALYTPVDVTSLRIPPAVIPQGIGVAMVVAVVATIGPTRAAGRLHLVSALAPRAVDAAPTHSHRWVSGCGGAIALCAGWGATFPEPVEGIPVFGYAAMLLLLLGFTALMPLALTLIHWSARHMGRRWPSMIWGMISAARLDRNAIRSTITMSALMVGLAITIGVGVMIHSFRDTVEHWIHQTMLADLIVAPITGLLQGSQGPSGTRGTAGSAAGRMPDRFIDQAMMIDGIEAVDGYREVTSSYQGYPIAIISRDLVLHAAHSRYMLLKGDSAQVLPRTAASGQVLVSESFFRQFHFRGGDEITLTTPAGPVDFRVAGVFYDYATDGGRIVMDRATYMRYWNDDSLNALAVYTRSDARAEEVGERLMTTLGREHHLALLPNHDLKERILHIFDETFAVTYALELIAILVALLGMTNALLASIVERRRELAILRSIGGTARHIRRIFLWESGYLGSIGTIFGCLAGLSLAFVLIRVVNMQSFGWSIQVGFPLLLISGAMIVTFVVSMAAGYLPARLMSNVSVARELQYE